MLPQEKQSEKHGRAERALLWTSPAAAAQFD
jgi:hypothetical protein